MAPSRMLHLLVPVAYVAVIALFLWLQFGAGRPFAEKVADLDIRGVHAAGAAGAAGAAPIKRITLSFRGAEFRFNRLRPLLLGESRSRLRPESFTVRADGASVELRGLAGRRLTLTFRVEPGAGGALEVRADTREPVAIPLESPGATVESSATVPALAIARRDERLVAILSGHGSLSWAGGYLYIRGPSNRLRFASTRDGSLLAQWLTAQGSLVSEDAYRKEVASFRDRAYQGWVSSRYLADLGFWRGADGRPSYTDRLGCALLAEAAERGGFAQALAMVTRAEEGWMRVRPTARLTHEASPFTGDMDGYVAWRLETELPEAREAERLLRAGNPSAFRAGGIVALLQSGGAESALAESGEKSLDRWDAGASDVATALGVLEAALDEEQAGAGKVPDWLAAAGDKALARIFEALRIEGDTPGVVSGDAEDAALSLRAGALLQRAAASRRSDALAGLGRSLVAAVLRTADREGFVAAHRPGAAAGTLDPEEVYHLARLSPYLPQVRPLGEVFGPGAWMWSAAPVSAVASSAGDVTLTFSFVPNVPHHVLIRGLPPFSRMTLKGIPWRPDPSFGRYYAGWFYDADKRSLALKLTQDRPDEQVVITR